MAFQPTSNLISKLRFDVDRDSRKIQDFFVEMLKINAVNPSMGGPGETERAGYIQSFLEGEGFKVTRVDAPDPNYKDKVRPNICTKLDGNDKSRTLWFLSHMDTVPEGSRELWRSDPFVPVIKEGKIIARGAEDNGQSLVSSLFALRELKLLGEKLPFNVGIWCVADEEFGSEHGVKYLLKQNLFKTNDLIVVPDAGVSDGRNIEIAEKNLLWLRFTVKGRQVHASLPNRGKNAHRVGMKLALDMDRLLHEKYTTRNDLFDEPSSTFEPTKVESNVPNINTVPGIDVFCFDCRVLPEYSLDDVLKEINATMEKYRKQEGVEITLEIVNREDAGPATPSTDEVSKLLESAIRQVTGKEPRFVGIGGQTVGNLFRKHGLSTAVWSTVDNVPHEPNEYSIFENLLNDTKVFAAMPLVAQKTKLSS